MLRFDFQNGLELFGFADDTLLVTIANSIVDLENSANNALEWVVNEIDQFGLALFIDKTEAVVFTNR